MTSLEEKMIELENKVKDIQGALEHQLNINEYHGYRMDILTNWIARIERNVSRETMATE